MRLQLVGGVVMEVTFTLKSEDFKAFGHYHQKRRSVDPRLSFRDIVVVLVSFVGIVLALALWLPAFCFGDGALLLATMSFIIATGAGMRLHGQWAVRDVRVILTANGLRTVVRGYTSMLEWSRVWPIGETDKHVFLYVTRDTVIIVARRAFRDDQHFEEFIALSRRYQQERGQEAPKSTGIITALPPHSDSFTHSE
jgi:hypothetical protein